MQALGEAPCTRWQSGVHCSRPTVASAARGETSRSPLISALLIPLLVLAGAALAGAARRAPPPSVLVVLLDDVGQDPVGRNWSVTPPHLPSLDALAAQGTVFARAYAWPVCSPTRFAALFGRLPRRANVERIGVPKAIGFGDVSLSPYSAIDDRLQLELVSLPEVFQLTHRTALFGKWHLGRAPGGGDMNQQTSGPPCNGFATARAVSLTSPGAGGGATGYYEWLRDDDGDLSFSSTYATAAQRDELLAWWAVTSGPRFAVLGTSDAHEPVTDVNAPPGFTGTGNTRLNYEQHLAYLDAVLADVIAAVSLADTYVVIMGDNGVFNSARPAGTPSGFWKGSTYEGGVRVPLVIAGPGIIAGQSSDRLVSAVDVPATLMELAGIACAPGGFEDSLSFADELGTSWAGAAPRAFVFTERYEVWAGAGVQPKGYDDLAVIESTWKYRRWDADGDGPGGYEEALYRLRFDPFEQLPLAPATAPAVYARMQAQLASLPARAR